MRKYDPSTATKEMRIVHEAIDEWHLDVSKGKIVPPVEHYIIEHLESAGVILKVTDESY